MESNIDTALMALSSTSEGSSKDYVNEFLFIDDCALNATTKANVQNGVDKFSSASDNLA